MNNGWRIAFETELGTLALFDPSVLKHRVRGAADWWRQGPPADVPEVESGAMVIAPFGTDGEYSIRVAFDEVLREAERPFARESVERLGVLVEGNEIFIGPGERIPGEGRGDRLPSLPGQGQLIPASPGRYSVSITALDGFQDLARPPGSPELSDFVVLLRPAVREDDIDIPGMIPDLLSLRARPEVHIAIPPPAAPRPNLAPVPEPRRPRRKAFTTRRDAAADADAETDFEAEVPADAECEAATPRPPAPPRDPRLVALMTLFRGDPALTRRRAEGEVGPRFAGGRIYFKPNRPGVQDHEVLVDELFKKLTRVREVIRVLEQRVNASEVLTEHEKIELQEPITRTYQSLVELSLIVT